MKAGARASNWSRLLFWTGLLNGLALCGLIIGLFLNYQSASFLFWLPELTRACWLLLVAQGLFAVVVMVRRVLSRQWAQALIWLLWTGLGLGLCAVTMVPITLLSFREGFSISVGEPPPGSPGSIEEADSIYKARRQP
jgi:hypothetical protein